MINSNDCILTFALDGENYNPVYCGTGFAITVDTEIVETTTKGDGQYQDFDYNTLSYSLTIDGLGKLDTYNTFDVLFAQRTYMDVPFRLICEEGESVIVIEGIVIVSSTDLTVNADQFLSYSHQFRGRGAYEIRDTIEPCYTDISSAYILIGSNEPTSSDTTVIITSIVGTAASFDWSVDGGAVSNSTSNDFLIGVLSPGSHSITITPICENGVSGIGIVHPFTI
jgi:hypothetical protein